MIYKLSWVARLFKRSSAQVTSKRSEKKTRFIFEEMEPRKLFSADPLGGLLEIDDFELPQVETLVVDHVSESYNNNSIIAFSDDIPSTEIEIRHEWVFVDSAVENYEQLIDDLSSKGNGSRIFSVLILDSGKNGIEQITEELQEHDDIDAMHIISHGTQGSISLGNIQLSSGNLSQYDAQISLWQNALDENADILIYGCELVGNEAGEELTTELSLLTGADVAASTDKTGNTQLGGDWELEFSTGMIETKIVISEQAQQSWDGLLAYHTYRDEFNDISFSNSDGSKEWAGSPWQEIGDNGGASSGQVDVLTKLGGEQGLGLKGSNNGVWREVNLTGASNATLSFDYARFSFDNASDFVKLEISNNGGGAWVELDHWEGPVNDSSLNSISYDISAYIATNTQIKFTSSGLNNGSDKFFVDNFQVAYSSNLSTKSEFLVNQNITGVQETSAENRGSYQSVAVASNGDYVVVWTEVESSGDLSDVFAQQYYADGSIKKAAFQVNTHSENEQQWASVASDASGQFVVTWTSEGQDGSGKGVYLRRFDESGNWIDANDIRVNQSNTQGDQKNAAVAINSQGEMVITWQSEEAGNEGIFARKFHMTPSVDISGSALTTQLITVVKNTDTAMPSVDINSGGQFAITWEKDEFLTYFSIFDPDEAVQADKILTNTVILGYTVPSRYQDIVLQESGDIVIADWSAGFLGVGKGIYLTSYDNDGTKIDTTDVLSNSDHIKPSIAMDLNGNIIVVYEGGSDGDEGAVFGRKYDSSLTNIEEAFQINETTTDDQQQVSIAMLDLDHYVAVWSGEGAGDNNGVFARQFSTSSSNSPPTLTSFSSPIDSGYEDVEQEITFAELEDKGNELDADGTVESFVVKAVSSGTLRIGTDALTATAWAAGSNDTINSTSHAYWTPALDANGTLNAFEVVAKDNLNVESLTNVAVTITVVQNAPPIADASASSPYTIDEGDSLTLDASNSSDPDSDTLTYLWDLDNNGTFGDSGVGGVNPTVDWSTLQSHGVNDDGSYTIGLKVDDGKGGVNTTTTTLIVHNTAPILSTTGFSTVAQGDVYTLTLSAIDPGTDTIISWTINWGDGAIETYAGNPSSVTHTYTNGGFTNNILASASDEDGAYLQNDLLVADYTNTGGFFHFSETGEFLGPVIGTSDLDKSIGIIVGPDGNWYGSGESGNVYRYNTDGGTSKVIMDGFGEADGLAFDSEGNLLVASWAQNKVFKLTHNTNDDSYTKTEIVSDITFNRPYGLTFGPNGDLYISSYADHNVQRLVLNGDGSYTASVFISNGLGGLNSSEQMTFGPDGKLYLTSPGSKEILRYNPGSLSMDVIATLPSGGRPEGLAFGPDGNLYISDHDFGDIIRFNMIVNGDGDLEVLGGAETFIDGADSSLTKPVFMTFIPEQQVMVVNTSQTPVIFNQNFSLFENSSNGSVVGHVIASDPDGDNLSYSITAGNSSSAFAISTAGDITVADSSQLDYETISTFSLTVQVMDDGAGTLSSTATISIHLNPVNEFPVINGQIFSLAENSSNGSVVGSVIASDPDTGDSLNYSITAGNSLGAFVINSTTGIITVANSSQLDFETTPTFNLAVQVLDDGTGNLSSTATISINLNPVNEVPVINDQTFALPENSINGSVVGNVNATDPDVGDNLSYFITAGNSSNAFVISTTGEIIVADSSQQDYETTSTFNLTVQVMDDGVGILGSVATISINLNPVNEVPVINDQTFVLLENSSNGSVVGNVNATDPDVGDSLSYSITAGNGSNAFAISATGEITVADSSQLDYETAPTFSLTVQVMDDGTGALNNTANISINLNPVNEVPVINDQTFVLLENSSNGSVVGNVNATDPDVGDNLSYSITAGNSSNAFAISAIGEITVADSSQLDYETTPTFNLTVQVIDDGIGNLSNTATINIALIEINELPDSISLTNNTIDEHVNTSTGYSIGKLFFSEGSSDNFQIIGGVDQVKFSIGGDNNELILTDGVLDFENQPSYQVTVRAIESDGGSLDETFIIIVNNLNEKPLITSKNSITLEENITKVTTVIAEDENQPIQKLSYFISGGADSELFLLDNNTGELSFKTAPDFESPGDSNAENTYWVEITVDDGNGGTFTQSISIQIENAAEAPNLSDQSVTLDEKSDSGTLVTILVANDPDVDDTFSYSILGGELSNAFTIDSSGQLIVSHPELLINQDNPIVSVVIQVTDSQGLTDTSVVQIDVRSILLNSSDETEVEIKPEAEIEKQEEFSFSVLTELPFEEGENITKNDIAIKPELNESVSEEQTKAEVNENTVNIILDTKQGSEINDSFGGDVKTKQEKSSFSTQKYNFNKQENNWTSKNILIKAKVVVGNTQIIPQFSYFEIATKELQYLIEESGFSESLDVLREQIQENTYFEKTVVGSSVTLTTGLSIGYVIWLVRGGVLLSSVLSSLPAWRMIDPLPVISSLNRSLDNDDKNSDSLASLIKKGSEVVKAKVKVQTPSSPPSVD